MARAVHVDERATGARAAVVDDSRDQSLAGSGLALQQDGRHMRIARRVERGQSPNLGAQGDHGTGIPEDGVGRVHSYLRAID